MLATWADKSLIGVRASVRCAFDDYYEALDYPSSGRNIYIRLSYDYD